MRRRALRLVITLAIAAAVSFSLPAFVHRRAFDRAVWDWYENPTPTTEKALEVQRRINHREELETQVWGTVAIFVGINGIWFVADRFASRVRSSSRPQSL
jgi:hypothetical protein